MSHVPTRRIAHRRGEVSVVLSLTAPRHPRTKGKPEKVEAHGRIVLSAIGVLAVDDPGLYRVKFQFAFLESFFKSLLERLRLRFCTTMDNTIIGVTAEWQERIVPLHPEIEHIVGEIEVSPETRFRQVKHKLENGLAVLIFDDHTETTNIFLADNPMVKKMKALTE